MTLNAIIQKVLKPIAEDHLQLNDFGFGDLSNYAASATIKYPIMWAAVKSLRHTGKVFIYNLSIVLADIVKDDLSNIVEIQSDMILVAADVAAKIQNIEDDTIEVIGDFNLTPFTERFTDLCAGMVLDLTLQVDSVLNPCDFPSRGETSDVILSTEDDEALTAEDDIIIKP